MRLLVESRRTSTSSGNSGLLIEVNSLTKVFGHGNSQVNAVTDLSFSAKPGRVTGFLGPNGAGKTTSLRCLVNLVAPTTGSATFSGISYHDLDQPAHSIGVSLGFTGIHPGRSAYSHLKVLATAAAISKSRIQVVLDQVGLTSAANRKAGSYSTGMKQRLSLATALLGDPSVLILDEPVNGLDPEGIVEIRHLLRGLAAEGRTILLSSHVLSEVEQTVDDVVIISGGKLVKDCTLSELVATTKSVVSVKSPNLEKFNSFEAGTVEILGDSIAIHGSSLAEVGHFAFINGIELHDLHEAKQDLEEVFLELTGS